MLPFSFLLDSLELPHPSLQSAAALPGKIETNMCPIPFARPPNGPLLPTEPEEDLTTVLPFPPDFTFPFLRLPPEVRYMIYRLLFKASVPLYPTTETHADYDRNAKLFL